MNLEFSLDGKKIAGLLIGLALLGVLIFFAGLLVGASVNAPDRPEQASASGSKGGVEAASAKGPQRGSAPGVASALAANPLAKQGLASLQKSNPALAQGMKLAKNPLIQKQMAAPKKGGGAPAAPAGGASPQEEGPAQEAPEGAASSPPGQKEGGASSQEGAAPVPPSGGDKDGGAASPQKEAAQATEGPKEEASDAGGEAEVSALGFAVQVGAFLMEKNARGLAADLEGRGYSPYIFKAQDVKDRTWFAVRIGDYEDRKEASRVASEFTEKEKMRTVVRPAGVF